MTSIVHIIDGEYKGLTAVVNDTTQSGKYLHVTIDVPVGDDGSTTRKNVTLLKREVLDHALTRYVYELRRTHPTVATVGTWDWHDCKEPGDPDDTPKLTQHPWQGGDGYSSWWGVEGLKESDIGQTHYSVMISPSSKPFTLVDYVGNGDNDKPEDRQWFAFHEDTASGIYTGRLTDSLTVTREVHDHDDRVTDRVCNLKLDIPTETIARFEHGMYFVSIPKWLNDDLFSYYHGLAELLRFCREDTKEERANGERVFEMRVAVECATRVCCSLWSYPYKNADYMRLLPQTLRLAKKDTTGAAQKQLGNDINEALRATPYPTVPVAESRSEFVPIVDYAPNIDEYVAWWCFPTTLSDGSALRFTPYAIDKALLISRQVLSNGDVHDVRVFVAAGQDQTARVHHICVGMWRDDSERIIGSLLTDRKYIDDLSRLIQQDTKDDDDKGCRIFEINPTLNDHTVSIRGVSNAPCNVSTEASTFHLPVASPLPTMKSDE